MDSGTLCRFPEWGRAVVRNFFLPSLNLFYDYTTGDSFEHRFDHLPRPEEIAAGDPDPCGWGSGMEDCALHAGAMLDTAIRCGEFELASRVLIGLESLVVRHGRPDSWRGDFRRSPETSVIRTPRAISSLWRFSVHGGRFAPCRRRWSGGVRRGFSGIFPITVWKSSLRRTDSISGGSTAVRPWFP